jgi:putative acetyltransferase
VRVELSDLDSPALVVLLNEHVAELRTVSPPESSHALDLDGLRHPAVTCWSVLDGVELLSCGALKQLDGTHAEIKSMRTATAHQGRGAATLVLRHLITEAADRGVTRLSLETGSMAFFAPARRLYERHGFVYCGPFGDYRADPHSVFMTAQPANAATTWSEVNGVENIG